jgi:nucleoside-diphosphate-sugar epimerase
MIKRILVTGAGGYIGTTLVQVLWERGYEVIALDRFFWGKDKLPPLSERLQTVEADIRFVSPEVFRGVDAVIDLAALSNDPVGELNPMHTWSINHLGRQRVCALAKNSGVKRYVLPSSCSIYGFMEGEVNEQSDINPLTVYAKANYAAENDVRALHDASFVVVVIRQATVYGFSRRMRFDLAINGMVKGFLAKGKIPILKDGTQWRPFVHVRDTSRAMAALLEADAAAINGQIFNVGANAQNYQIFDLAGRVAKAMQVPFAYEWYGQPDHRSYRVNFDKIQRVLGWAPEYDAERGAAEVAQAVREKRADPDDPMTITLNMYKKLIAEGVMI